MRAEISSLRSELHALQTGLRLGGEARGWRAQLVEAERLLAQERREHNICKSQRNSFASQLKAAEKEVLEVRGEVVTLQSEISLLRKRLLRRAVQDAELATRQREVRMLKSNARHLNQELEAAQLQAAAAAQRERRGDVRTLTARQKERSAKAAAREAEQLAQAAEEAALEAREQLMVEEQAAREAKQAQTEAEWAATLAIRRAERAKLKAQKLKERLEVVAPPTKDRAVEQWLALSRESARKATQREREHLRSFFSSHRWRASDLVHVLDELGMVEEMFGCRAFFDRHFDAVKALMKTLEDEHYCNTFGLFLHYELHLPLSKILSINQAACKQYNRVSDRYEPKVLLHHKFILKAKAIAVPRLAPPGHMMMPLFRSIEAELGVRSSEDGRLAFTPFLQVVAQILEQDAGTLGMPAATEFDGGKLPLPIVISLDATGFGSLKFNTIAARNPYMSASSQQLRTFGVGNCDDNREGSVRLLGPNLDAINQMLTLKLAAEESSQCMPITLRSGQQLHVRPDLLVVQDVAALRHCEHLANSGW